MIDVHYRHFFVDSHEDISEIGVGYVVGSEPVVAEHTNQDRARFVDERILDWADAAAGEPFK